MANSKKRRKKKKKSEYKGVILIIILIILLIGFSFAFFTMSLSGKKTNVIEVAKFDIDIINEDGNYIDEDTIGIINAVPMSDEEGLKLIPYTFTVINNGDVEAVYDIFLDELDLVEEERRLDTSFIKYKLVEDKEGIVISNEPDVLSNLTDGKLFVSSVDSKKSVDYTLYLWIDEEADNDAIDKEFLSKLRVEAKQVVK